ncbi:hypothetical protein SERLA73DRAFT_145559 [Serpula lacrymans var. lacrymans S7.3]|uniref:Uncharacterized protein n=1 Tax=Serpula lacrymans var. lacrymans (strain S7.3) TaxID=936435 RepID=F8QE28_SERL3|nr:hypothetical protein SERLA73DRAFT_145559 [Serpula lacrymans var. lacrymans S7.3]
MFVLEDGFLPNPRSPRTYSIAFSGKDLDLSQPFVFDDVVKAVEHVLRRDRFDDEDFDSDDSDSDSDSENSSSSLDDSSDSLRQRKRESC